MHTIDIIIIYILKQEFHLAIMFNNKIVFVFLKWILLILNLRLSLRIQNLWCMEGSKIIAQFYTLFNKIFSKKKINFFKG